MRIFIICPVRNADPAVTERIKAHVSELERLGHTVHWPARDTYQDDPIGFSICVRNVTALEQADEVHIWHDPASVGSIFDLGALFMTSFVRGPAKKIVLINADQVAPTAGKSFTNVVLCLARRADNIPY